MLLRSLTIAAALLVSACSKSETKSPAASGGHSMKLAIAVSNSSPTEGFSLLSAADDFAGVNILSGAPQELQLKIKKITLEGTDDKGSQTLVPIFVADSAGEGVVKVTNSTVDLSGMFEKIECLDKSGNVLTPPEGKTCKCGVDADGNFIDTIPGVDEVTGEATEGCPGTDANTQTPPQGVIVVPSAGKFTKVSVEIDANAKVKGCVGGRLRNAGYNDDRSQATSYTMCTQKSKGMTWANKATAAGVLSDFDSTAGKTAELTDYLLDFSSESINLSLPIEGGVEIGEGIDAPQITLLIDTNRMLRFWTPRTAISGGDQTPNPGMPNSGSYFYMTGPFFGASTFVFVGRPGSIQGFEYSSFSDRGATAPTAVADLKCSSATNEGCHARRGWLTMIYDTEGKPMLFNLSPDDDNAGFKGANRSANGVERDQITTNATDATKKDLAFSLNNQTGKLYGFSPAATVGSSHTTNILLEFDETVSNEKEFGEVVLVRKL